MEQNPKIKHSHYVRKMLKVMEEGVRGNFADGKDDPKFQLTPVFIGLPKQGRTIAIPGFWKNDEEKALVLKKVRIIFEAANVVAYGHASESWIAPAPPGFKGWNWPVIRPADDPRRIEVVTIIASDGITSISKWLLIKRDERGCPRLEEPKEIFGHPYKSDFQGAGPFHELLGVPEEPKIPEEFRRNRH